MFNQSSCSIRVWVQSEVGSSSIHDRYSRHTDAIRDSIRLELGLGLRLGLRLGLGLGLGLG